MSNQSERQLLSAKRWANRQAVNRIKYLGTELLPAKDGELKRLKADNRRLRKVVRPPCAHCIEKLNARDALAKVGEK
jgi:hypothetical protein